MPKTININNKEYEINITMGVLEDLEDKGYPLSKIGEEMSVKLVLTIIELSTGIDRTELRKIKADKLPSLVEAVTESLNDFDSDGEQSGE